MRPIKLELQGFTSFRERCEIDFSKLDLFAITGPTGAGKSSLLDAITYALYGRTERLGKSGRDLISQGAAAMQLTFEFKAGSEIYRVFRRIKPVTATVRLEKKEPDGSWTSITSSIKHMEEEIVRIVGLEFDAFTRAVILPQGKFDEFLRGDSGKRKIVLAELLNLSVYRNMMHQANQRAREHADKASWADQHVDNSISEQSLAELTQVRAGLDGLESESNAQIAAMENARPVARELIECHTRRDRDQRDAASADEERQAAESQLSAQTQAKQENNARLDKLHTEILSVKYDPNEHLSLVGLVHDAQRMDEIRSDITRSTQEAEELTTELDKATARVKAADAELVEAEQLRQSAQREHEKAQQEHLGLIARYGSAKALDDLRADLRTYEKKMAARSSVETRLQSLSTEFEERNKTLTQLKLLRERAEAQFNAAEAKLEKVSLQNRAIELRRHLHPGDSCPVCERTVTALPEVGDLADLDKAKRERKSAAKHVDDCKENYVKAENRFELLGNKIILTDQELRECSDLITTLRNKFINVLGSEPGPGSQQQIDQVLSSLEQAQIEAESLAESADQCIKAFNKRDRDLQSTKHAVELTKQKLNGLGQQLQRLQLQAMELDRTLHGRPGLRDLKNELERQESAKNRMEKLVQERESIDKALNTIERTAVALKTRAEAAAKQHEKAVAATVQEQKKEQSLLKKLWGMVGEQLLTKGRELDDLDVRIRDLNGELSAIRLQIERNRGEIEDATAKLKKNRELLDEADKLRKSAAIYHELAILLDLKNFQQYLLAASFTRLAVDGSRYIEDLTNGRYSFTCKGDDFDVQDHWNGDDARSASTLSGGEAFLASLSLALALAQGIVELSGDRGAVALECLFLDEGFSTLDPETLGRVADALPLLQKSGRMIGVITHVHAFAEQLPSQIEIIKTPTGSRIVAGEETFDMSVSA